MQYPKRHEIYRWIIVYRNGGRMEENNCKSCDIKGKHRANEEYDNLMRRMNKIEGQVRGIKKMLDEERYCVDILTQVSAIQAALNSFNKVLLTQHIKSCVIKDIQDGNNEVVDELCTMLQKLMK